MLYPVFHVAGTLEALGVGRIAAIPPARRGTVSQGQPVLLHEAAAALVLVFKLADKVSS